MNENACEPRVSAIMIFLNEAKFIREAINSVLVQTYDRWELLLVDDGSTDGSTVIAQQYANKYRGKVRYLEHDGHQNRGMSASRNLGIREARGEYITFLDADDLWLSRKLERHVQILDSRPEVAMVCGRAQWWYSWSGKCDDNHRDRIQPLDAELDTRVEPPRLLILSLKNPYSSLCNILVRRSAIKAVGGYEDSFPGMYEDQVFRAKLCLSSPAFISSDCFYRYRQHPEACTAHCAKAGTYYLTRQVYLDWLEEYLSQKRAKGTEVWKVLQKELWKLRHPRLAGISNRVQDLMLRGITSPAKRGRIGKSDEGFR
jgi:glycosyltransferase involved in cell wall biosynthesis